MTRARRDGIPVRASTASALVIAYIPALVANHRAGSISHDRERWETQGNDVIGSVDRPAIRAANVRPPRFAVVTPSPT